LSHPVHTVYTQLFIIKKGKGRARVWRRGEGFTGFWWGNLRERDQWGDPDVDGRIILRWIFRKWEEVVGTG